MARYKVYFYDDDGKRHFYTYNFENAKKAKSWERAYNKHTKADDHVHVDTTKEIPRKRRTHSARRRSNSYSMNLFGGNFRL
jgi:hypothetical protein